MSNQLLSDFIEIINETAIEIDDEPIEIEGNEVTSISWLGDVPEGYTIPDQADHAATIALCKKIMRRVFDYPIHAQKMDYYTFTLEEYITKFAQQVKKEWQCFQGVSLEGLPVYITENDPKDSNGNYNGRTTGTYRDFSGLISIYNASYEHEEKDQKTARHETLHYMIAAAGLDNSDDSPMFWFFATVYDADPYKEMTKEKQQLYEALKQAYESGGKKAIDEMIMQVLSNPN